MGKQNVRTFSQYTPHRAQLAYHQSKAKERIIVSSIRAGKTYGLIHDMLVEAWNIDPDEQHSSTLPVILACAPTYSQTRDLLFEATKTLAIETGLYKRSSSMLSGMEIQLKNSRIIKFRTLGANAKESIRGLTVKASYIDEASLIEEEAINIVRGRMLTTNGRLTLATTPKGRASWLYQNYFSSTAQLPPNTEIFRYHITDNPTITREALEHLRTIYSPLLYAQEVEGEFVSLNSRAIYYEFNWDRNVTTAADLPFDPKNKYHPTQIYAGIDYNIDKNPAILAYRDKEGRIIIFDELYGDKTTSELGRSLISYFPNNNINNLTIIDDAKSGHSRAQTDGRTNREILRQLGFNRVNSLKSNPPRIERYGNVNAHLCNAFGNARVLIHPRCKNLLKDLQELEYKENSDKPDTVSERLGHASDALGYLLDYISPWSGREGKLTRTQTINIQR